MIPFPDLIIIQPSGYGLTVQFALMYTYRILENGQIYSRDYILQYDNFGENYIPLYRKGMATFPKNILILEKSKI